MYDKFGRSLSVGDKVLFAKNPGTGKYAEILVGEITGFVVGLVQMKVDGRRLPNGITPRFVVKIEEHSKCHQARFTV